MARFITDMGFPLTMIVTKRDDSNQIPEESVNLGRYGVWEPDHRGKNQCFATGDDLESLQAEHGPDLPVLPLTSRDS